MQVIFIQQVPGVAQRDEVREVKEGFALNYLLPQGLAVRATPERVAAVKAKAAARSQGEARARSQAEGWARQLAGQTVVLAAKASDQGTLYASISAPAVASAVREQLGVPLEPHQLALPQAIKSIGSHQVTAKLAPDLTATFSLTVNQAT